jgi:hypothetical protein
MSKLGVKSISADANNRVPISTFDQLRIPDNHRRFLQNPESSWRTRLLENTVTGHYSLIKNKDGTITVSVRPNNKKCSRIENIALPEGVLPHMLSLTDSTARKENQVLLVFDAGGAGFVLQGFGMPKSINSLLYINININGSFGTYLIDGKSITRTGGQSIQKIISEHYTPKFHEQEPIR